MFRGTRPKPTALRLITGNPGRRPLNTAEAAPGRGQGLPKTPAALGEDAKKEWRRVARELHQCGLLTNLDRTALAAYCAAYGRWAEAERALADMAKADPTGRNALLVRTSNGTAVQNPLIGIANKAAADMLRYASEFGMTPSARSRVHADTTAAQAADKAHKYF